MPIPLPPSPTEKKATLCTRIPRGELCRTHSNPNLKADDNRFLSLRDEINRILGPSSGIDSSDVSVDEIMDAMKQYISSEKDWNSFALSDPSRNYTRNFVDHGNGKANLLLLVWNPGKGSLPHDHAGAHCIMKVCHHSKPQSQLPPCLLHFFSEKISFFGESLTPADVLRGNFFFFRCDDGMTEWRNDGITGSSASM
jgi:hypothetical protein